MISYQNLLQTQYQKEKEIPITNPLQRPKEHIINTQPSPVPQPFNTLLPINLLQQQPIENEQKSINQSQRDLSIRSNQNLIQMNPQEQILLDKQQELMYQGEDLKSQLKRLQNENQQLRRTIDQLQPELQQYKNQKSQEQDLKAKLDYQEDMIVKLKSENRRQAQTIQDNSYKLQELEKLQKKIEEFHGLTQKYNDQIVQIKTLEEQVQDQKRQIISLNQTEHENHNLKDYIEIYKQQLRDKDVKIEQLREQAEHLYLDNKKMKGQLDMLNFELKKNQENSNDQIHRLTIQITELQGQLSLQQKNYANLTHQNELQRQQVKQLEMKEKELYSTKNQCLKLEEKIQEMQQQSLKQTKDLDKLALTLKNGKQEYLSQQQKLTNAEIENKRLQEQVNQLNKQRDQLQQQCQFLEQELKRKQGNLDQSINQAQNKQIEMKNFIEKQQFQIQQMEAELQKRDGIIYNLEQQSQNLKNQIEQVNHADSLNKNELSNNFAKMKEMHNDLVVYEKQVDQIGLENHQLKIQNSLLADKNGQLEFELGKLRDQLLGQDNRIRVLENELHNYSFQQKLNTAKTHYTPDQIFPTSLSNPHTTPPQGSFNTQFNFYK